MRQIVSALFLTFVFRQLLSAGTWKTSAPAIKIVLPTLTVMATIKSTAMSLSHWLKKNFAKMDKPGDGVVSKGEMRWRKEKGYGDL